MTNKIQFQKQRDLGEIITDTFKFVRENYKQLSKLIFKIAGPVFVILLLALGYYSYLGLDMMGGSIFDMNTGPDFDLGLYFISLFILFCSILAFYVLLYGTILNFIKSYVKNDGNALDHEVYAGVKDDFGSLLGLLILAGLIVIAGVIFCFFPGVYLWVPMSLAPAIMILGKDSVSDAIGDSFSLIKDNWWITFFSLLVMTVLVYIISLVFQFPLLIYYFIKAFTMSQEGTIADPASLFDWVYVVFNVISTFIQYLLMSIVIISTAFIYYNLDEKKNFTGAYNTISNLGSSEST